MRSTVAAVLLVLTSASASAEEAVTPPPLPVASPASSLLTDADGALDRGELEKARALYQRIATEFADTPEAPVAERVLKAMRLASGKQLIAGRRDDLLYQLEPYSTHTGERVRLSTWEKLDFGITAFLYGASVGSSYAATIRNPGAAETLLPILVGSLGYTFGAVAFLSYSPDRGDLPLVLAISAYLPSATTFTLLGLFPEIPFQTLGLVSALTGTAAIPVAILAAYSYDTDPGDTQLVRDAGFWGMVLALTGAISFSDPNRSVPAQSIGIAGMVGLYGGLGIGFALARNTEVSLERVRVTTWGGYGGVVVGTLIAIAANPRAAPWPGMFIGAMLGLTITFIATDSIDAVPADAPLISTLHLSPTIAPVVDRAGVAGTSFGLSGTF
jgi:hypothetical protein